MNFCAVGIDKAIEITKSNKNVGLTQKQIEKNKNQFGINKLTKKDKKGLFTKITEALFEPMLLILLIAFLITLGINLGKFFKSGDFDFVECLGIFLAITLSVSITLIMEGSSERAFNALNKIYDNISVRVIREGKITFVSQTELVVGDIVLLNSGDKVYADGRLIKSDFLSLDESALTGESLPVEKDANAICRENVSLAERNNMVYSGTFVLSGEGVMLVTAVGDKTEIGKIAKELTGSSDDTPLQQKLNKLSKTITIIGTSIAIFVTILNIIK
ncbi:MAG: magnesium-transporting ATPase, partial [Firmicutes bacterium]|nr:magnesium-transporting ATPase [Candidatus Caballimonas caccae]